MNELQLREAHARMYWVNLPFEQAMANEKTRALVHLRALRLARERQLSATTRVSDLGIYLGADGFPVSPSKAA